MAETLFPVFVKLTDRKVVLVGGGVVAAAKYAALRAAGARITVVAPAIGVDLRNHGTDGTQFCERDFQPTDLDGAFFVIAAAPPEINQQVATAAHARGLFVNAVDDKAAATAYLPAIVRSGPVTVAVSTGGDAPALSGLMREAIEAVLPAADVLADWHAEAARLRTQWKADAVTMSRRRPLLLEALNRRYGIAQPMDRTHPEVDGD